MLITLETGRAEERILTMFNRHVLNALFGDLCSDIGITRSAAGLLAICVTRSVTTEESVTRQIMPAIQIAEQEASEC